MSVQEGVRTARLELRLSVQERERIEAKALALGMSLSDYVRMCALAGEERYEDISVPARPHLPPWDAAAMEPRDTRPYKCPAPECDFHAGSAAARCPGHGRLVVPV